jgi:hypothetical protein
MKGCQFVRAALKTLAENDKKQTLDSNNNGITIPADEAKAKAILHCASGIAYLALPG